MKVSAIVVLILLGSVGAGALAEDAPPITCKAAADCSGTQFCDTSPNCNDGNTAGLCRYMPEICTLEYMPVKACDGKTYANKCHAFAAGQPVTGPAEADEAQ